MTTVPRRIVATAAALALLSLGGLIREQLPDAQDRAFAPFNYGAEAPKIGRVDGVHTITADAINGVPTHARWLVVEFTHTPDTGQVLEGQIKATDGTLYGPANHLASSCGTLYPQLPTQCTLVFEMPAEQIAGARLFLHPSATQMAPRVVLELGEPVEAGNISREGLTL